MERILGMNRASIGAFAGRRSREMLGALLAVPLLLLLALTLLTYGKQIVDELGNQALRSIFAVAIVASIIVAATFVMVIRREKPVNPPLFLACSLTGAALLYYAYISSIEVVWISDFKGMWEYAVRMVDSGDYSVHSIYNERALPVLVPMILLFGAKASLVPIVNLLMLLCVQLAGYDLARRIAGHRAAQGFTVLWIGAMEPIMALPITSHDIWGLFYLVVFLWGFRVLTDYLRATGMATRRARTMLGFGIPALALLLTLLDMQRELAPFVILGFLLAGLMVALHDGKHPGLRIALVVSAPVIVLHLCMAFALKSNGAMLTAEQGKALSQIRIGAYSSSLANGSYAQGQVITKSFFHSVDDQRRADLVKAIPLSDFVLQPASRITNILYRARGQAQLGSQYYFYQSQAQTRWDWLLLFTRAYNVCYSTVVAALALWLILPLIRRLDDIDGLVQLALLSSLVGVLLVAGESQPRYVFPLWFVLPQLIAMALAMRPTFIGGTVPASSLWGWDMTRGVLMLLVLFFLGSVALGAFYGESRGRILSGWAGTIEGAGSGELPPKWFRRNQVLSASGIKKEVGDQRAAGFGRLALVLKIPMQVRARTSSNAAKVLCSGPERTALDFYYFMPYQNPQAAGSFTLEVLLDGRARWQARLPGTSTIQHANIPAILPPDTCGTLAYRLTSNRGLPSASWVNASQVDVYFPRLVR